MSTLIKSLGACPVCGAGIPSAALLIEYATNEGSAMYAKCPDCREVVHPTVHS